MAYTAVVSVAQILDQLMRSVDCPKPQIESLYGKVCFLQSCLEEIFPAPKRRRGEADDLETQIRDVIYEAQDTLEFFISSQIRSDDEIPSILLEEMMAKLDPITASAEKIRGSIRQSKENPQLQTADLMSENRIVVPNSTRTVGLDKDLVILRNWLVVGRPECRVVAISGMGGVGKTTLAQLVYCDSLIVQHFDIRCWAAVSQEDRVQEILRNLVDSLSGRTEMSSIGEMGEYLYKYLKGRRYLIVMDDVRDELVWKGVRYFFPNDNNGSRILLTTRNVAVANYSASDHYVIRPLDKERSWTLLCEKVFGQHQDCPPELEDIGRSIAEKCGGIPLSIVVVAGLLSKSVKTVQYWTSIEEDVHAAIGDESYSQIFSLSYNDLPIRLKACFLYIGAFPKDSEILVSKVINLWVAEGFLTSSPPQSLEQVGKLHLKDLIDRNLIAVCKSSSDGQPKTCRVHGTLHEIAVKECQKEKNFLAINRYAQELSQGLEGQRRIYVYKNILMCAEDVYECTRSVKLARTLLYTGIDHHHPLPFCLTFDLLRVLDALSVYFIELPSALFELIHLRYLAFTYDEDIPPSISKLRNLLILIVQQHPKIIIRRPLILPVEIWNMSQIRHLLFTESVLPDPYSAHNSAVLENLQSLANINAACCTEEMVQNMPNLKKLGIWIEAPGALHLYVHLLPHLEALKFTVLKPNPEKKITFLPELVFPRTLSKLSLSGCGIPWEDMTIIGKLPCLEVLKLRELAFLGPEWCPIEGEFLRLKFLLLESLDLVDWCVEESHFPCLKSLIIRHCYELEEISSSIGEIYTLQLIKLVHCSPPAVLSACKLLEEQESMGNDSIQLHIHSSREWKQRIIEELKHMDVLNNIQFSWE